MADYSDEHLQQRLVNSAVAWLGGLTAVTDVMTIREFLDAGPITPADEAVKKLRLIVTADDEGRAVSYAPIRNVRLGLTIRGNCKTEGGEAEGMRAAAAVLERLVDDSNLKTTLDSGTLGVRVMLAVRRPGAGFSREGMIRMQRFEVECKCVAQERVTPPVTCDVTSVTCDTDEVTADAA